MLKQRLLTAGLLIPFVVAAILLLPTTIIQYLFLLIVALAALEWLQMTGFDGRMQKSILLLTVVFSSFLAWHFIPAAQMLLLAGLFWSLALLLIISYANRPFPMVISHILHHRVMSIMTAIILFSSFCFAGCYIHQSSEQGPALLLYVLVAVWLADTGGYFAGKRYGKHKLAVMISPNKTWEGVAGAFVLSSVWAVIVYFFIVSVPLPLFHWFVVNLVVVSMSVVGDLLESVFKRQFNIKDSGNLLPGHGGILDRIDSLLSAFPVFVLIMMGLGAI